MWWDSNNTKHIIFRMNSNPVLFYNLCSRCVKCANKMLNCGIAPVFYHILHWIWMECDVRCIQSTVAIWIYIVYQPQYPKIRPHFMLNIIKYVNSYYRHSFSYLAFEFVITTNRIRIYLSSLKRKRLWFLYILDKWSWSFTQYIS